MPDFEIYSGLRGLLRTGVRAVLFRKQWQATKCKVDWLEKYMLRLNYLIFSVTCRLLSKTRHISCISKVQAMDFKIWSLILLYQMCRTGYQGIISAFLSLLWWLRLTWNTICTY